MRDYSLYTMCVYVHVLTCSVLLFCSHNVIAECSSQDESAMMCFNGFMDSWVGRQRNKG